MRGLCALASLCLMGLAGGCVTPAGAPVVVAPDVDKVVAEQPVESPRKGTARLWREFSVGSQGRGTRRVGAIDIAGNVGTVAVDDKVLHGLVYEVQDWHEYGYVLYDVLAVDAAGYYVVYLYCRDGKLTDIYWESFWDDLEYEKAVGTCVRETTPTESEVTFGPVEVPEGLVAGYVVDSERLAVGADGIGHMDLLGRRYDVYAFSHVGCAECKAGDLNGWDELHVMLDLPGEDCFGILYLYGNGTQGERVQFGYGFCTNPIKDLPSTVFDAPWQRHDPTRQPAIQGQ